MALAEMAITGIALNWSMARISRAASRGATDRMEQADRAFHDRVESAFARFADAQWQTAHPECGPIIPVPADGDVDRVEARVWQVVAAACPEVQG